MVKLKLLIEREYLQQKVVSSVVYNDIESLGRSFQNKNIQL